MQAQTGLLSSAGRSRRPHRTPSFIKKFIKGLLRIVLRAQTPESLPSHALWYYEDNPLPFTPEHWNAPRTRRLSNCYSYAINLRVTDLSDFAPQPGQSGLPFWTYLLSQFLLTRQSITQSVRADGLLPHDLARPVPPGYYLVAMRYRPGFLFGDYHWYRLDQDKSGAYIWTHKPGTKKATNRDHDGHVIRDLSKANLGLVTPRWGGYFLVPREGLDFKLRPTKKRPDRQRRPSQSPVAARDPI